MGKMDAEINLKTIIKMLKKHEGSCRYPYIDTTGHITIGIGRNLTDNGLSDDEVEFLLKNDIINCWNDLHKFEWFSKQSISVKNVLIDMCFNLGLPKFLQFKKMIAALDKMDFNEASKEALDSLWAKQNPRRAREISDIICGG